MVVDKNTQIYVGDSLIKEVRVGDIILYQKKLLPEEYQQVEYIESSGTQYIDTNFVGPYIVKAAINPTAISGVLIGAEGYNDRNNVGFDTPDKYIYVNAGGYGSWKDTNVETGNWYIIEASTLVQNIWLKVNGADGIYTPKESYDTRSQNTLYIFASHYSFPLNYSRCKLAYLSLTDSNGNLVRNFIPCYRKSDNVIGLYDSVLNQFFINNGSGSFIKGPDV